jgi:hypothetical protein
VFLAEAIIEGVLSGELSLSHIIKVSKNYDINKPFNNYFCFFFNYLFNGICRGLRIQQTPPAVPEGFKQNGENINSKKQTNLYLIGV